MHPDTALSTFRLDGGASLPPAMPWADQAVTLETPAIKVMTDLTLVRAATVHPATPLHEAEQMMILQGVRMLFVLSRAPAIEGLITSTDLHGDRQLRLVHDDHRRYDDLRVADVMTGLSLLEAVALEDLRSATVANLIATLKRLGRNHMLVVERAAAGAEPRVRGLISRSQIERQLGQPITITPIASSFSEIERALA